MGSPIIFKGANAKLLNSSQAIEGLGLEQLPSDPVTNLFKGRVYFNNVANVARAYNGTIWVDMAPGATPPTPAGITGFGYALLGSIVAFHPSGVNGTIGNPSAGAVYDGWQWCNGGPIAIGQTLDGTTPNLDSDVYLRGSTVSGTGAGSNTVNPFAAYSAAGNYIPGGTSAAPVVTFDTNSLDSASYQTGHAHAYGFRFFQNWYHPVCYLNGNQYIASIGTTAESQQFGSSLGSAGTNYANNPHGSSGVTTTGNTIYNFTRNSETVTAPFIAGTYATTETAGAFTGTAVARNTFFLNSAINNEPSYINVFYMMRVS